MSNKIKKYLLIIIICNLFLAQANLVYAQNQQQDNYQNAGVSDQIKELLCAPTTQPANQGSTPYIGASTAPQNNANSQDLFKCINNLYRFALIFASVIAVFFIVIAGYIYMSAEGNTEATDKAKSILTSSITALVILFAGYILLKALNPDLIQFQSIQPPSVAPLSSPSTTPLTTGGGGNSNCQQSFGVSPSAGCSGSSCVPVSSYTSTHDCSSNGGTCLLSSQAAQRAQNFINSFNQLGGSSGCSLKISSAIQGSGGPSASGCHHPGNNNTGTCVDFNVLPYNPTCQQAFYQAAQQSGAVVSFLDEYVSSCATETTTGGNIHVNF